MNYLLRGNFYKNDVRVKMIVTFINEELNIHDFEYLISRDLDGLSGLAIISEFKEITTPHSNPFKQILIKYENYGIPNSLKKIPFRVMDLKYSYDRNNVHCKLPSYEDLFSNTIAGKKGNYCNYSIMDIYSITHTIFYICDMGFGTPNKYISTEIVNDLFQLVNTLIVFSIRADNMDILGELLMCLFFLSSDESNDFNAEIQSILVASWEIIEFKQCSAGNIHSPTFSIESKNQFTVSSEYEFIHSYHTTLVILGAVITNLKCESRKLGLYDNK